MKIDPSALESHAPAMPVHAPEVRPAAVEQPVAKDSNGGAGNSDPGDAILRAKINEMNARYAVNGQQIAFEYNNESRKVVVRVIDKQTQQVLRQMPSAEALNFALTLDEHIGNVIREKA